jgi:uncharacterized protein YyaL (SSP411 family)
VLMRRPVIITLATAQLVLMWAVAGLAGASPVDPPGAESFPGALKQQLASALAAKGSGYEPRTHHLNSDGTPKYINRLMLESSPYLLQHAHNPVNWYPWGDEAFELARKLDRPVLLSVGYSTCHWCHVMERESFEDEEIAEFINRHYIAIKVDREERPDVDSIYMTALRMLTRGGGWPMTMWLTPDRQPFFGRTYIPARDGDRGTQQGFLTVLGAMDKVWRTRRSEAIEQAGKLAQGVAQSLTVTVPATSDLPSAQLLEAAASSYRERFDTTYGGLDRAPKFPSSMSVRLLLRAHQRTGEEAYLEMAALTLEKMAAGGMFDQVGGGFHRYSTDQQWLVPHFEKMLYDNAQLVVAYLEGYQASGRQGFADVARRVLDYVDREMTAPEGGFFSATDADSPTPEGHSEEGWFFTWTPQEVEAVIGPEETRVVAAFYGMSPEGNFEGRTIFNRARPAAEVAAQLGISEPEMQAVLKVARARLYRARELRPPPILDDKVLTSWNGLMISAFAVGSRVLDEPRYAEIATKAAEFILTDLRHKGRLRRTWRDGASKQDAFLDDYAFLIAGLIDLYQATSEPRWLVEAIDLQKVLDADYWDEAGGYFLTSAGHEALLAREKPTWDGAEPSGNSVALMNLARLTELTTDDAYRARADALLKAFAPLLTRAPTGLAELQLGLDFRLGGPKEIVLITPNSSSEAEPFLRVLRERFLPQKVVVVATVGDDLARQQGVVPFLEGKVPRNGLTTAYVCERFVCQLPTTDVSTFAAQLVE